MAPSRPPRHPATRTPKEPRELLKKRGADLIRKISDKDRFAIFLEPVDLDSVDGYSDLIERPMDLSTVAKNLQMGIYRTPKELRADLDLIWSNCCSFNTDDSIFFKEAVRLRALSARYFDDLLRLLTRDGVGAALGITHQKLNVAPSNPRLLQKRPPRHRASLPPLSDPRHRNASSAHSSDAESDGERRSPSPTGSASANQPQAALRDSSVRRAQASYDAALEAYNQAAADAEASAQAAGLSTRTASRPNLGFRGPNDELRNPPCDAMHAAMRAARNPIFASDALRDRCADIPLAWSRIGRWHARGATHPRFLSVDRGRDVRHGRQFQRFIQKSAPVARRLLAVVLDPDVVRRHDLQHLPKSVALSPEHRKATASPTVARKNAKSAKLHPPVNGSVSEQTQSALPDCMDIDDDSAKEAVSIPETNRRSYKRPRAKQEPAVPVNGTRPDMDVDSPTAQILLEVLGQDGIRQANKKSEQLPDASLHAPTKTAFSRLRSLLKGKGLDAGLLNNLMVDDHDATKGGTGNRVTPAGGNEEGWAHERGVSHLLSANYEAMMNTLRLRSLRETVSESMKEDVEDRERECIESVVNGVALAVEKIPPRVMVHPLDAAETAKTFVWSGDDDDGASRTNR